MLSLAFVGGRLAVVGDGSEYLKEHAVLRAMIPISGDDTGWTAADVDVILNNCGAFLAKTVLSLALSHCLTIEETETVEQRQRNQLEVHVADGFIVLGFCFAVSRMLHAADAPSDFHSLRNHVVYTSAKTTSRHPVISRLRRHREEKDRLQWSRVTGESQSLGDAHRVSSTRLVRGAEFAHLVFILNNSCRSLLHSLASYLSAASRESYDLGGTFLVSGAIGEIRDTDAPSALQAHEAMARSLTFSCRVVRHNRGIGR